jgi:hypothetical protein
VSNTTEPERSQAITFQVPRHLVDAFIEATNQFFAQAHEGTTPAQRAAEVRAGDRDAALDSLALLFHLTEDDSGQAAVIARFLASLYNGKDFPFDMTELRDLDEDLLEHCLAVLRLDSRHSIEIHRYFPDGEARWQAMVRRWCAQQTEGKPLINENGFGGQTYSCKYVCYSDTPGYRDVTLFATVRAKDQVAKAIGLSVSASDCARLAEHLTNLHRRAWTGGMPSDAEQGEQIPEWLTKD